MMVHVATYFNRREDPDKWKMSELLFSNRITEYVF